MFAMFATQGVASASGSFGPGDARWVAYYANPSDAATWTPFCQGAGGSVQASADGVPACGPTGNTSIGVHGPSGIVYYGDLECTELVARFVWVKNGLPNVGGDGGHVAWAYHNAHPQLALYTNGTVGHAPQVGDVISFSPDGSFSTFSDGGHVAAVTASNVDPTTGTGTITTLNENWNGGGALTTVNVTGWVVNTSFDSTATHIEWVATGTGANTSGDGIPGETQYMVTNTSGNVYHSIRYANGSWQGWGQVTALNHVVAIAAV